MLLAASCLQKRSYISTSGTSDLCSSTLSFALFIMSPVRIPFNRPSFVGNEPTLIQEAIAAGHFSGDGIFTKKCNLLLENTLGVRKALLTTNCTHALEMSALLLDIQPGDEFLVPSFTFVSTANAFVLRGAKPIFVDVRPDTLNIDEQQIEKFITPRTKAMVVVHYAGVACEMDTIMQIANKHGIPVVEDNAHGLFGKYKDKFLGTIGCLATQSFHETKNFSCGEGGALLVNDEKLADRAEIIREKGTNRSLFFRGMVDKYSWVDLGSSYLPSDLLAAFLFAQLEERESIQAKRRAIWERYNTELRSLEVHRVSLPVIPEECEQAYHMFYLLLPSLEVRQALIAHLKSKGILAVFHYLPLNLSTMGLKLGGKKNDCPVTEDISDRLLRLPFYNSMTEDEQTEVIKAVCNFFER
jgi:dTDP-4-amino-4,6-dideoxygalactose transaminase